MEIVICLAAGAVGFALASWLYGSYISKLSDDNDALWDEIEDLCDQKSDLELKYLNLSTQNANLAASLAVEKLKTRANESN